MKTTAENCQLSNGQPRNSEGSCSGFSNSQTDVSFVGNYLPKSILILHIVHHKKRKIKTEAVKYLSSRWKTVKKPTEHQCIQHYVFNRKLLLLICIFYLPSLKKICIFIMLFWSISFSKLLLSDLCNRVSVLTQIKMYQMFYSAQLNEMWLM